MLRQAPNNPKGRVCVLYLFLAAVSLGNAGCLLAAAGVAAGGAATYYYVKGRTCREFPASFKDTWAATTTAMNELGLPALDLQQKGTSGQLTSRTGDDSSINIDVEIVPSRIPAEGNVTRVCVRVGTFGDEAVSERILNQIGVHLAPQNLVPTPVPSASSTTTAPGWTPAGSPAAVKPPATPGTPTRFAPIQPATGRFPAETEPPPLLPPESKQGKK